jgi:hypothetical protein
MSFILLWVAASAVIGWFGRKRIIGFWGFFVISLLLSPVIVGLFLLIAAPGKRYIAETEERVAASLRRAGVDAAHEAAAAQVSTPMAVPVRTASVRRLAIGWLVTVAVFAGFYFAVGAGPASSGGGTGLTGAATVGVADAVRLSFHVATLGSGDDQPQSVMFQWGASLERLIVLAILVLLVASLISAQMAALKARESAPDAQASAPTE